MRRVSVISAMVGIVGFLVWLGVSCTAHDRNRGFDTTCGDLVAMTHTQQLAVMKKAGVAAKYREQKVAYFIEDCTSHPEDRGDPIGDITG